ncbi:MAG: hypothetical protein SNJ52_00405 [Verrucomicrobiia bacterium]
MVAAFITAPLISIPAALASQTIFYPSQDQPVFSVTAPDDWVFTAAEDGEDYFTLANEHGTTLYFRAIEGTEASFQEALDDAIAYVRTEYSEVTVGEPIRDTHEGNPVIYAVGSGTDGDGNEYYFSFGFIALPSGQIGEVWFEASVEDEEGIKTSDAILKTFSAH